MIYLDLDMTWNLSVTSRKLKNSIQKTVWPSVVVMFSYPILRSGHVDDHGKIRRCTIKQISQQIPVQLQCALNSCVAFFLIALIKRLPGVMWNSARIPPELTT